MYITYDTIKRHDTAAAVPAAAAAATAVAVTFPLRLKRDCCRGMGARG